MEAVQEGEAGGAAGRRWNGPHAVHGRGYRGRAWRELGGAGGDFCAIVLRKKERAWNAEARGRIWRLAA